MGLFKRLVSGTDGRRTRFHDWEGRPIDVAGMRFIPHAVSSTLSRRLCGYYCDRPWLGYRAARHLDGLIRSDWRILEFASGTSTVWFARRSRFVLSVESDRKWYERVSARLRKRGIDNVEYRYVTRPDAECLADVPDGHFDFVLVDGIERAQCCQTALSKVAPGGWIYLDNSNFGDFRAARDILLQAFPVGESQPRYFVDFVPGNIMVTQGLLIRKPHVLSKAA